jgi:hypothetical protein
MLAPTPEMDNFAKEYGRQRAAIAKAFFIPARLQEQERPETVHARRIAHFQRHIGDCIATAIVRAIRGDEG